MNRRGLENASIPVWGSFWRTLGHNGTLATGYFLIATHVVVLLVDVVMVTGGSYELAERWELVSRWSTIVLPLASLVFVSIGETIRRGDWRGPSGHKPDAVLPQGSNTVAVAMLPWSWHVVWGLVGATLALAILAGIVADEEGQRLAIWSVNGAIAAGSAGAAAGSLVKKWSWSRGGARRAGESKLAHPALAGRRKDRSRLVWRWLSYRWRLDVWACAMGLVCVWAGALMLVTRDLYPGSAASTTVVGGILLPAGVALAAVGGWATTQFWRSGEDLAVHESFA